MRSIVVFAVALALGVVPCASLAAPPHRQLLRVNVRSAADVRALQALDLDLTENHGGGIIDVVARAGDAERLSQRGFTYVVLDSDMHASYLALTGGAAYPSYFHTYASMLADMQAVHAAHPTLTSDVVSLGLSLDGRDIWAIQVSTTPGVNDPTKPEVLMVGNHHAREPISVEIPLDLLHQLTEQYGLNTEVTDIVNTKQVWIVPMLNPDGHVYCETTDEFWRKNRRNNGDGSFGVDLNRNYSFKWGFDNNGSSGNGSSDTYRGTAAFSEPETRALRDFQAQHTFTRAITWHSYANAVLYPWGYSDIYTPDQLTFSVAADSAARFNGYTTGTDWEVLYNVNGEYCDWAYGDVVTKPREFAVTIEVGETFYPTQSNATSEIMENRKTAFYWMRSAGTNDTTSASLTLSAHTISVPRGGTLAFSYTVKNNTASTKTWTKWSEVVVPGGKPAAQNPPGGFQVITLGAGATNTTNVSKVIPSNAALGTYTWTAKVAQTVPWPVLDSDVLLFTITTAASADKSGGTEVPFGVTSVSSTVVPGRGGRVAYGSTAGPLPASVPVVDVAGRAVGAADVTIEDGLAVATWDGRTSAGGTARRGIYFVRTPAGPARLVVIR